jgi:hypothetical protein
MEVWAACLSLWSIRMVRFPDVPEPVSTLPLAGCPVLCLAAAQATGPCVVRPAVLQRPKQMEEACVPAYPCRWLIQVCLHAIWAVSRVGARMII